MQVKIWTCSILFCFCTFATFPLRATYEKQKTATTYAEGYCLSKKQIIKIKRKIAKGDGTAARRLSDHYGFCDTNNELFLFWLHKAAKLGNKDAIAFFKDKEKYGIK